MKIAVIGLNHRTASTEIRERAAFTNSKKIEALHILLEKGISEAVILSTCNRSEIYIAGGNEPIEDQVRVVKDFYQRFFDLHDMEEYFYGKYGAAAALHLYQVAAGLDSIVLGEDQILGQVKEAHEMALEQASSKKILNRLFREAVSTAKKIKAQLKISENPLSISSIGVQFLKQKVGSLQEKKVMIIGLGKMGRLALQYVQAEGCKEIYMANRNCQKVLLAADIDKQVIPVEYEDRYTVLPDLDVLISATAAPHTVIKAEHVTKREKELYILDLALPRDVESAVGDMEKVHLYNIDHLKSIAEENEKKREDLSIEAKEIIVKDIEGFQGWLKSSQVDPVISSLQEKCSEVERKALQHLFQKTDLNPRDRKQVEKFFNAALQNLIREPILKLKQIEDDETRKVYMEVVGELFNIKMG